MTAGSSDVTAPVEVSRIQPAGPYGAHNCLVDGHYLYVVGNHDVGGAEIFDILDPAHPVKVGDALEIRLSQSVWQIRVAALSDQRGPASRAQLLYEETAASRAEREISVPGVGRWEDD